MAPPNRHGHDQQPLLHDDHHHHDVEADSRFTIDDDIGHNDDSNDVGPQRSARANAAPKYPPLPPSYDDTMRIDSQSSKWNPASWFTLSRTTREHLQACVPRSARNGQGLSGLLSAMFASMPRCWPANRFAQASIFILGLWIIVIFTGPSLYDSATGTNSPVIHQDWDYNHLPESRPAPLKGDGKIVQEASWKLQGCITQSEPVNRVLCTETAAFLLDPNKAKDSFSSTDSIFVDVDPSRSGREEPAGSVPGTIEFVHEDYPGSDRGEAKGMVQVEITAKYDQKYKFLFDKSLVAKTKRGVFDEGVEILTYAKAGSEDKSPLVYKLRVRIPKGINVPTMNCDAGASNIDALFGVETESGSVHARGGAKKRTREALQKRDNPWDGSFYFGKFHAKTQLGHMSASNIHALAEIELSATNGNLKVGGKLVSRHVGARSANGHITLSPGAIVEAYSDVLMQTSNGRISLEKDSSIRATTIRAETANGPIEASDATLHANHTLSLHSDNGRIEAAVSVHRADLSSLDGPGLEPTEVVSVEATSATGPIKLTYKEHEAGVPLHSKAVSELAKIEVHHHKEFQGAWDLRGATQSKIRGPGTKDGALDSGRKRRFVVDADNFGWINRHARGRIWWEREGQQGQILAGARSQLATQLGMAMAFFE
ncbi:uncharacterized protein PFL1_04439 [Pseudozyma flocculosa PF-1]|uniref:Uncharacterized protein n=2 Tax=Pseudozyma flocculosa TaxID=84751 RepID=A0A5C3FEV8_9BASI|nr:uncharacterized protein PFL1_04439 [Pseudozyma flocculosa PF-1]EPQ28112.1 hypothetical protein PFL1_04439 [Pseudozyma flocculosa PF-1]SPO41909.1 uncharacterized protein PSFLO_07391 [Pseudozyma flocculosa]